MVADTASFDNGIEKPLDRLRLQGCFYVIVLFVGAALSTIRSPVLQCGDIVASVRG